MEWKIWSVVGEKIASLGGEGGKSGSEKNYFLRGKGEERCRSLKKCNEKAVF